MGDNSKEHWTGEREEEVGVLGQIDARPAIPSSSPSDSHDESVSAEAAAPIDEARREELTKMAANMIIPDEPRGNYFVSNPGL